jgi:hypothetical protein
VSCLYELLIVDISVAFDPWDEDALYGWGGEWIVQWSFSQKKQVRKISLKSKEPRFVVRYNDNRQVIRKI